MNPQIETIAFALNEYTSHKLTATCVRGIHAEKYDEHRIATDNWWQYIIIYLIPELKDMQDRAYIFLNSCLILQSMYDQRKITQTLYSALLWSIDYKQMAQWILIGD